MQQWNHDELHKLINTNTNLKYLSDLTHSLPSTELFDTYTRKKRQMMYIYAQAVGCKCVDDANIYLEEVTDIIKSFFHSVNEWKNSTSLTHEFKEQIEVMKKECFQKKRCCSVNGNDYVCYCDEHTHYLV